MKFLPVSLPKVVIIASQGKTTEMLFASLSKQTEVLKIILETPPSRMQTFKRRAKKLGWMNVIGQIAFLGICYPFIPKKARRISQILRMYDLSLDTIPSDLSTLVETVNDESLLAEIDQLNPELIVLNGTRIIRRDILEKINVPIVNLHVGITPAYRGIHGGYWALYEKNPDLFGITLHYVDSGIDTGNIIAQQVLTTSKDDNFKTYPILQYAAGIKLLEEHLDAILTDSCPIVLPNSNSSKLHYHPTIWQYLFGSVK